MKDRYNLQLQIPEIMKLFGSTKKKNNNNNNNRQKKEWTKSFKL